MALKEDLLPRQQRDKCELSPYKDRDTQNTKAGASLIHMKAKRGEAQPDL